MRGIADSLQKRRNRSSAREPSFIEERAKKIEVQKWEGRAQWGMRQRIDVVELLRGEPVSRRSFLLKGAARLQGNYHASEGPKATRSRARIIRGGDLKSRREMNERYEPFVRTVAKKRWACVKEKRSKTGNFPDGQGWGRYYRDKGAAQTAAGGANVRVTVRDRWKAHG